MHTNELFNLKGKVAIVTGGSIGLGLYAARALAEMGANVVLAARNVERCSEAAEEIKQLGVGALAVQCDVTSPDDVSQMVNQTVEEFGSLDILLNNAGISWAGSPENMPLSDWKKVIDINITGTFLCSQAAGRVMIEQKKGKIINLSSVAGLVGFDPEALDTIAYNTSKGAIGNFTRDLACKWAKHNINVNAIAPGWFPTHMSDWLIKHRRDALMSGIPLQRFGSEDELKGVIAFLASDASNYMTGHTLVVDGGITAW